MSTNWRLGSFFAVYFALLGAIIPYFTLYLESLGFSPQQIGILMSTLLITKIVAPVFWGYLIDKHQTDILSSNARNNALVAALFFSCIFFSLLNFTKHIGWIAILMVGYSFFWNAVLPQFEALVYNYLGEQRLRYGRIRMWGSIGFIVLVISMGSALDEFGIGILLPSVSVLFLLLTVVSLSLRKPTIDITSLPDEKRVIKQQQFLELLTPTIVLMLFFSALGQMSHAPYYTFFSIYLEGYGYSKTEIGWLWALGVMAEVFIFFYAHHLLVRCDLKKVLAYVFATTGLRWWLIANFPESITLIALGQSLHAISFGLYHATMSQIINQHFVGDNQVRGQALYSSFTFGFGGAVGSLSCGFLWARLGGEMVFLYCAVIMVLVGVGAWLTAIYSKKLH